MLATAIAAKIYLLTGGIIHIHQMRGITAIRKFRIFLRQVIKTVLRTTITIEQTSPMNERRQAACRIGFIRCLRILIALISYTAVLVSLADVLIRVTVTAGRKVTNDQASQQ